MPGQCLHPGQKGGDAVGPNPTDRGKPGTKRHVFTERGGLPLASLLTGANRHDSVVFEEVLDAVPPIKQPNGRRRKRPDKGHADKGYDYPEVYELVEEYGLTPHIRSRGEEKEKLEREPGFRARRWVVERTHSSNAWA